VNSTAQAEGAQNTQPALGLSPTWRFRLALQREVGRLLSPVTTILVAIVLRFALGYRIEEHSSLRSQYRALAATPGPLLICANHLTMIDSFLIGWALASPVFYVRHFSRLPWNVPERSIFAANLPLLLGTYILKCIPIVRGGRRKDIAQTLARVVHVLRRGETALIFPEGRRSRSGRVELDAAEPGVGRVVRAVEGCRVLCVYLRGRRQTSFSKAPVRGDHFHVALRVVEPKSDERGLRASRGIARQITQTLVEMEEALA